MDDAFKRRLYELEDALRAVLALPRKAGLFEAQRIASEALAGGAPKPVTNVPTLADPRYYARVRRALEARQNNRCCYCQQPGTTEEPLQIDHDLPVSRGGGDQPSNLLLACSACNRRKGTQTSAEFGYPDLALYLAGQTLPDSK